MPKPSTSISHVFEYLLLRVVQLLLTFLPRPLALRLGSWVGMLLHSLGIYRSTVKTNLEYVGLWDTDEQIRITKSLYRNIGRYAVDFLRPIRPLPNYRVHDFDKIDPLLQLGRGTIVILGHLGNWEMLATVFGERMGRLHVIAKNMHNSIVDRWLLEKRTASAVSTIYTDQALRKMLEVLRNNGIIAILIDQFGRHHGTPVPFLGKEANTVRTVAGLVRKTGCSVVSITAIMQPDGTYDIPTYTVPEPDLSGCSEAEIVTAYQKTHNDILSEQIRTWPEHWFGWFHRRFRDQVEYKR
ncbi:MAG: lysophospholipid acyltransferase family protein [Chitinispirillaceae bacterium]|nr:lysophospholipid acyltransferase family protein [Chitinispirillaceae bacterium]